MTAPPTRAAEHGDDDALAWADQRDAQIDAWLATTPAQRLAWLEDAIVFAHRAGALPRPHQPTG